MPVRTAVSPIEELKRVSLEDAPTSRKVRTAVSPIEELKHCRENGNYCAHRIVRTAVSPIEELKRRV